MKKHFYVYVWMCTKLINLRQLNSNDTDNVLQVENDERYWHLSDTKKKYTRQEIANYISNAGAKLEEHNQIRFVIEYDNEFAGLLDLYEYDADNQSAGIGIIVIEKFRIKGIARNALSQLLKFANKKQIRKVFARIEGDNIPSIKLFDSFNFQPKKELKNYMKKEGILVNCREYWLDINNE